MIIRRFLNSGCMPFGQTNLESVWRSLRIISTSGQHTPSWWDFGSQKWAELMKCITSGSLVNSDIPWMHVDGPHDVHRCTNCQTLSLSLSHSYTHTDNYQHRADVRKALTMDENWNECLSKIRPMFISQVVHTLSLDPRQRLVCILIPYTLD